LRVKIIASAKIDIGSKNLLMITKMAWSANLVFDMSLCPNIKTAPCGAFHPPKGIIGKGRVALKSGGLQVVGQVRSDP